MDKLTAKILELREEISPTGNKLLDELLKIYGEEIDSIAQKIREVLKEEHETI